MTKQLNEIKMENWDTKRRKKYNEKIKESLNTKDNKQKFKLLEILTGYKVKK